MSVHEFFKEQDKSDNFRETVEEPPHFVDNSDFPFSIYLAGFCCIFLVTSVLVYCFRSPKKPQTKEAPVSIKIVFNLQNLFQNPVFHDAHFHQGDQMVPTDLD